MIPLMMTECVDHRAWMTSSEFTEALGLCNMLPGPISAKMSLWVGFRVAGPLGAIVAFTTVMTPALVLMGVLMAIYYRKKDSLAVQGAMVAIKPAVVALLVWVALTLGSHLDVKISNLLIGSIALGALFLRVHPAIVVSMAILAGAIWMQPPTS